MAEELEDLPYEELRHRAFKLAEKRHDIGFFYDLLAHTPSLENVSDEGGSLGDISGSLIGVIEAAKEAFGHEEVGEMQPLFVARFATNIREHESN
jgi:hypothetical protein